MSLLDDVSIVVTPNGYKAGELYAVIPVPTEGADVVENGDFSDGEDDWFFSAECEVVNNQARIYSSDGGFQYIRQSTILNTLKRYKLEFDVISSNGAELGITGGDNVTTSVLGKKTVYITPISTYLQINRSSGVTDVVIDNVSVKEYTSADMDVTRATAATRVDENGLVNYAEVVGSEQVTNGDFATDSDWIKETGWTISGGTSNRTNTGTFTALQQNILTSGKTYKVTFTISAITSGEVYGIRLGSNYILRNKSTTGTYTGYGDANNTTLSIMGNPTFAGSISSISVKEVTRDNVPRIDYTGGGCPHILAEPQRTNLIEYSEAFDNAYWTKSGASVTSGFTSPDGTDNAFKLVEDTSTGSHYLFKNIGGADGSTNTASVFAKKEERTHITLYSGANFTDSCTFNLVNGTSVDNGTSISKIEPISNGWYKCSVTSINKIVRTYIMLNNGSSTSYTGDGTSGVYIYGASLEEGSYPTSYIPTNGEAAGVTRNQDIFTRDGIGSLIGQTEGTFFIELSKPVLNPDSYYLISLNNAAADTNANSVTIGFDSSSADFYIRLESGGSTIYVDNNRASLANTFYKIAVAYKSGQSLIYIDGSPITPNSGSLSGAFSFSETLDNLSFDYDGNNSLPFFGKVKQLQVYDTSLSDNQLIQLTGEAGTHFFESYAEMAEALTYTIQ